MTRLSRLPLLCCLLTCFFAGILPADLAHAENEQPASASEEGDQGGDEVGGKPLPLPRFASLRNDEANARVGPGKQYAIRWVYRRAGLPVEIIEQFEHWRKVRDPNGDTGWLHKSMLVGKRTAMIKDDIRMLLREPEAGAGIVLRAEPGVIGEVVACEPGWCRIQIHSRKGWLPKSHFFGAYPAENFH